ncbi:MAG: hypothetical protein M3355_07530 [Actinomycetota bacterium]|nr:hypothetical protein [Actinomycetota bacterium]
MAAPGGLTELGEEIAQWDEHVAEVTASLKPPPCLTQATRANATELRVADWPAVPVRARACLGEARADRLCDARPASGETGRMLFQEEYAEWRVMRDGAGPTRFELTTELGDYWVLLARHQPERLVELVADFAGMPSLDLTDVLGESDPRLGKTPEEIRAEGFSRTFLGRSLNDEHWRGPPGPFNSGERAITCLSRSDNSLVALIKLVAASAIPLRIRDRVDGELRFPSGSEAIPKLAEDSAQDCRASDPLVAERIVRLATEGRPIRFDDPIGVYIVAVQTQDLLDPGGQPIPDEWVQRTREGPPLSDGLARHQRLTLEVPKGAGFKLSEVVSRRSGETIQWGAQIAELVELAVYVRVGVVGCVPEEAALLSPTDPASCAGRPECEDLEKLAALIEAE